MGSVALPDSTGSVSVRGSTALNVRGQRYELLGELASGGMGTVHLARMHGPLGWGRLVAIKTMHPRHATDPAACAMFLDEAQITAHLRHPNLVSTVDFVSQRGELMLVMDYVEGDSLRAIQRGARGVGLRLPPQVACAIARDVLSGLHAAHESRDEEGRPLGIIHRDVSPDNVLVGLDGITRVLDFGVAHAKSAAHVDPSGTIRGKVVYMAPEHLARQPVDRTVDIYSVGALLWEALTGRRLHRGGADEAAAIQHRGGADRAAQLLPPSSEAPGIPPALDAVVLRMLAHDPRRRPRTAQAAALELEAAMQPASPADVGRWVARFARPRPVPRRSPEDAPPPYAHSGDLQVSTLTGLERGAVRSRTTTSSEGRGTVWSRWARHAGGTTPMLVFVALLALGGASAFGLTMRASARSQAQSASVVSAHGMDAAAALPNCGRAAPPAKAGR